MRNKRLLKEYNEVQVVKLEGSPKLQGAFTFGCFKSSDVMTNKDGKEAVYRKATKPENAILFKNFIKDSRVFLLIVESQTVSETILKMIEAFPSADYMFGMPDTFFIGENPYKTLLNDEYNDLNLALWKIEKDQIGTLGQIKLDSKNNIIDIKDKDNKCKYELFWGAMKFNLNFINFINKNDSHPGLAIKPAITNNIKYKASIINGKYFDCGTMDQYKKMIVYDTDGVIK